MSQLRLYLFYKYMGLFFTPKLKWTRAKEMFARRGRKSILSILQYQRNFGYFNYTTQSLIGITFLMQHKILTNNLIESKIEI